MRIDALLREARRRLETSGAATPGLDARVLAAAAFGLDSAGLISAGSDDVDPARAAAFQSMLERRLAGEPVGRILGRREFHGLELSLNPDTLEPRPDTETLVDFAIALVGAGAVPGAEADGSGLLFADIGTGSGAIALALAAALHNARGIATDISAGALAAARLNAARHGLADRLAFRQGSYLGPVAETCGLIVSNPPYVPTGDIAGLPREVRDHDPPLALDGGADGLDAYRALAVAAPGRLLPGGWLAVEIGSDQAAAVRDIFLGEGLVDPRVVADIEDRDRVVAACAASPGFEPEFAES